MRYLTPRKAATGLGAAHGGTADHWRMTVTGVALAILAPLAVAAIGGAIGLDRAGLLHHFGRPFPAVALGLFVVVGMVHWTSGTRIMVDDYLKGGPRAWVLIAVQAFGWLVIALAVYALARMALAPEVAASVIPAAPVVVN